MNTDYCKYVMIYEICYYLLKKDITLMKIKL